MTGNKGQEYIIEACAKLLEKGENRFDIKLVGDGYKADGLRKLVNDKKCENHISFEGFTKEVLDYYRNADVFIMSSAAEAFGRTTVEAMMSGCLVIGMNSGATPEIIQDGKTGIIISKEDATELSNKMAEIINNPSDFYDLAVSGQQDARNRFSSLNNAACVSDVYSEVLFG